jgi:hypothetical protein
MSIEAFVQGFEVADYHTETANTAITEEIQARDGYRLGLKSLQYLAGATGHLASFQYAKDHASYPGSSRNTASELALSGQKDITVTTAPKSPAGAAAASGDVVAYQLTDGTWEFNTVDSISGSVITLTNNINGVDAGAGGTAIAAGGKVLILGIVGDGAVMNLVLDASVTNKYYDLAIIHPYIGEPFFLSINNVTNAGFLESLVMVHINK